MPQGGGSKTPNGHFPSKNAPLSKNVLQSFFVQKRQQQSCRDVSYVEIWPNLTRPLQKLSVQYCLKLSSTAQNPVFNAVFACKFKAAFDCKPNQIPPLGIRMQPDLHAIGFKQKDILQSSISATLALAS